MQAVTDDTLQRTLVLAQKFVDQTKAEAEAQARSTLSKAEERARGILVDAEDKARSITQDTERHLREEVGRLESLRTELAQDVETIARHLDGERTRMRSALVEMLEWVDKQVQPASVLLGHKEERAGSGTPPSTQSPPSTQAPQSPPSTQPPQSQGSAASLSNNGPNSQGPGHEMQRLPNAQPVVGGR